MDLETSDVLGITEHQSDGMRSFFGRVYNYMAGGLAVSGITAYLAMREPMVSWFYNVTPQGASWTFLGWVAVLAPLVMIFMISSAVSTMNAARANVLFWVFSALMGVSLSNILWLYSDAAVFQAFLVTSASFLGLSLYGVSTKKSLASWGAFLFMGLLGAIIAMVLNIFLQSAALNLGVSVICVFIFVGLTIYDTNRLKMMYREDLPDNAQQALAINGALALYLDFINLFRLVLYFLNDRR